MTSAVTLDELLAPFVAAPNRAGILTDFDGTLSPIVDDPDAARPLDGAVDALHALALTYRRVAVVSGRPASFLDKVLRLEEAPRLVVSGSYGLEYAEGGAITVNPSAEEWRPAVERAAAEAEEVAPDGVFVERKGLSVTLHYRVSPELAAWVRTWTQEAAARTGLVMHSARMSEELRPPVPVDKGLIVAELASDLDAVVFMGDDIGDLPAFEALDRLSASGVHTLKVVATSTEAPQALLNAGDIRVSGPDGALEVLQRLLGGGQ